MFHAFSKGVSQLGDPRTRKVLWLAVAAALATFAVLWLAIGTLLGTTTIFAYAWLELVIDLLGGLATGVFTWFLFPAVVSAVIGVFLDDIAAAVEARHYPALPPATGLPIAKAVMTAALYLVVLVALNLVLLVFLLLPPLFPFVFYGVNGYLLGREFFELVALRRTSPEEARRLRKAHRGTVFLTGVVTALLLTIPVVNLLAPVVVTATMVHLFENWRKNAAPETG